MFGGCGVRLQNCSTLYLIDERLSLVSLLKRLVITCIAFFSIAFAISFTASAQTATATQARHETLDQDEVQVRFDNNVVFNPGLPSITGFTVRVNGTAVTLVSAGLVAANTIFVRFSATSVTGNPVSVPGVNPGNTVTISYDGSGNLRTAVSLNPVNTFTNLGSQNNAGPSCADFSFNQQGEFDPGNVDICDPVRPTPFFEYIMSKRYRNSSLYNPINARLRVAWGDPGNSVTNYVFSENFSGGRSFIRVNPNQATQIPATNFNYPNPDGVCAYTATVSPTFFVSGLNCPIGALVQQRTFQSYSTDNRNTGLLRLNDNPVNSRLVCLGTNANLNFVDATDLNCRAGIGLPNPSPNEQRRWVRFVYGFPDAGPGLNVPNVRVNGVNLTDGSGNYIGPVGGYVVPGAGGPGVEDFLGVVEVPANVTVPTQFTRNIQTTSTSGQVVGQRFNVTMQYWNVCNPYNFTISGQEEIVNFVEIIGSPNPPTVNNPSLCETAGTGSYLITANGVGAGTLTYTWYRDAALTQVLQATSTDNNFNVATEGPLPRVATTVSASTTEQRFVTVTQGSNNCTSQPATITIRVDDQNTAGVIGHPLGAGPTFTVCSGTDPASFSNNTSGTGGGPGGTFTYQWQSSPDGVTYSDIVGQTSATFDPGALTARTFFRRRVRSGNCADVFSNFFEFRVDTPVTPGSIGADQTICATPGDPANLTQTGAPGGGNGSTYAFQWEESTVSAAGPFNTITGATAATYNPPAGVTATTFYRRRVTSGVCTADGPDPGTDPDNIAYSNVVTVTVHQTINPGSIGNAQTRCSGQDPNVITNLSPASGGDGSNYAYQWQQATALAGPFSDIVGATGLTFDPPVLTATTFYRRRARSPGPVATTCPEEFTNVIEIAINPLPTAANPTGGGSVCSGNPAPDINWTLTGTPPFNITYTTTPGGPVTVLAWPSTTFTITGPSPMVNTTYQITSLTDFNGCVATAMGGTASVTIGGDAPNFDTFPSLTPSFTCADGASTADPQLNFSLLPASTAAGTYTLVYRINGGANQNRTFSVNLANGDPSAPITFTEAALNSTTPSPHVIRLVSILTPAGCQTTFNTDLNFTVNPRPPAPTGAVSGIACNTAATGAPISVTDPGAGFTIVWSSTAAPTFTAAAGVTGGTRGNTFTPTSNASVTYHAFTRSDLGPTNCVSSTSLPVQHIQDVPPTTAAAGADQQNCTGTFILAGNLPNTGIGEVGTWTVPGIAYIQNFSAYANGTTTSAAVNGWTIDTSAPGTFAGGQGSFNVQSNVFEASNLDGSGTGGVEVVWRSPVISGTFPSLNISAALSSAGALDASDYLRVFYRLNGGAETLLTNGNQTGAITGTVTATATGLNVTSSIQLVIRARNNAAGEIYRFDNISMANAGAATVGDINTRNTTVTGLPVGVSTLTWTITSRFGVCPSSSDNVLLERYPLPSVVNLTPTLCEDTFGGGSAAGVNLTTYNASVMGGTPANTVVEYYPSSADRTAGTNQILAPITVTNGLVRFTRVRNTLTGCVNDGTITFTTRTLPAVTNQTAQVCENFPPGSNQRTGFNLTSFENAITGGAANRDVEWYTDAGLTALIPAGVASGAEQNYTVNADITLFAKVIDTASPTTPQCFRSATLTLDYQPRPLDNQITDGIGTTLGASYSICASGNLVLLQINPGLNAGSTYQWTIPPVSYPGEFELLSGTTGFFVILRFPNSTNPPAWAGASNYSTGEVVAFSGNRYRSLVNGNVGNTPNTSPVQWQLLSVNSLYTAAGIPISIRETLGTAGCFGNTITTNVVVEASPPKPIISGPSSVCENQSGVVFSISNPVAGTYSWTLPPGATITSLPVTASTITVQMSTFGGSVGVTHSSGTGCTSPAADPLPVTAVSRPSITSLPTATLCSGQTVSAVRTLTSSIVGTTFNWQVIAITGSVTGTTVGNTASGVTAIAETLTNTSGLVATVTYRITPIGPLPNNCAGATQDLVVTVNPEPVLVAGQNKTICSKDLVGYEIRLSPLNLPAGTRFNWPDPDGAGPATSGSNVLMGTAGTIHINDQLTNTTTAPINVVYVITPVSGAGCTGASQPVTITINPEPVGQNDASFAPVCSGATVNYNLVNNVATLGNNLTLGTTFQWVAADNPAVTGESLVAQTGNTISDVITNQTGSAQTVVYTVTPRNGTCVGNDFTVTISVNPEPVSADGVATRCSDLPTGLTLTTTGGAAAATWTISINANGLTASAGSPVSGAGQAANAIADDAWTNTTLNPVNVIYTVTPVSLAGCSGAPRTITLTVNPEPVGSSSGVTRCSDVAVGVSLTTSLASVAAATYNISVNANGLTLSGGISSAGTGRLANELVDDVWRNTGTAPVNVEYTIIPVSGAGCAGDAFTITVMVNPEPVGVVGNIIRCSDEAVAFNLGTTVGSVGAATYNITVNPNGLTQSAGTPSGGTGKLLTELADDVWRNTGLTFVNVIYTITPVSGAGCEGDSFTVTVRVNPEPVGNNSTATVCSDVAVGVNLTTLGTAVAAASYNISTNANGLTQSGGTPSAGTGRSNTELADDQWTNQGLAAVNVVYTVTPVSSDNCLGDPFTVTVTINPEPIGNPVTTTRCSDEQVNVTLSTSGAAVSATSYNILVNANGLTQSGGTPSGGTSKAANELVDDIWRNTGLTAVNVVYTITPISAAGCAGDAFTVTIQVNPEPVGSSSTATRCSDEVVGITLSTSALSVAAATYTIATNANGLTQSGGTVSAGTGRADNELADDVWRNTSLNPVDVVYTVTPVSADNCAGNPFTVTVTVRPEPVGTSSTLTVCSDNAVGLTLTTSPLAVAAATYNIAVVSNGLTQSAGIASAGTGRLATELQDDVWRNTTNNPVDVVYTITPVSAAPASCLGDAFTITVTVNPEPVVAAATVSGICSDTAVGFTLSAGTSVPAATYNISVNANGLTQSAGTISSGTGRLASELADDRWTNTTALPVDVIYTIIPVSASPASCQGDAFTVTVQILPEPVVASSSVTRCSDVAVGVTLSAGTAVAATTYNISVNANGLTQSAGTNSAGTGRLAAELADDVWTNTTQNPVNVVYTITPVSAAGCEGNPFTVTATINPEPVGSSSGVTRCSDVAVGVSLTTSLASVAAATYNISVNANGLTLSGGISSAGTGRLANELVDDVWRNTGTAPVNVEYTIIPVSGAGCAGDAFTITVMVNPEPVGVVGNIIRCSDEAVAFNLGTTVGSVGAATYNITVNPNGLTQSAGTPSGGTGKLLTELADDVWRNTGLTFVNVIYTITPVSGAGCEGDSFTVTVRVNPEPVGNNSTATVCSDVAVGVNLTTLGTAVAAASYNISTNANGLTQSGGTPSAGTGRSNTELADDQWTNQGLAAVNVVYTVTPVSSDNCLGDPFTVTVTINPEPIGNPVTTTRCSDEQVNVTLSTSGAAVSATSYNILVNANGLTQSGGTPSGGTSKAANELVDDIWRNTGLTAVNVVYTITPISAAGCAGDAFTVTIQVNPEPVGSSSTATRCSDEVVGITLSTSALSVAAATYTIATNANGLTQSGGTVSAGTGRADNELADDVWRNTSLNPVDVVYTVTPVSADNCAGNPFTVTVTVRPEPVGTSSTLTVCSDNAVGLTLTTSPLAVAAATYNIAVVSNGLTQSAGIASAGTGRLATELQDDVWRNTTNNPVDVVYTITPVSAAPASCLGDAFTITVTVNPEPVVAAATVSGICSDTAVGFTLSAGTSVPAATYNISVNANGLTQSAGTISSGTGRLASELADDRWTNTTALPVDVIYTIIPVSASPASCQGDAFTVTVQILPEPVVASSSVTRCSDVAVGVTLSAGTAVAATTYNISVNANGLTQSAGTNSAGTGRAAAELSDDVWRNTGAVPVNVVYTITPVSAAGCEGNPFTVTATINPEPVGVVSSTTVCSDLAAGINISTLGTAVPAANFTIAVNSNGLSQSGGTSSAGAGRSATEIADDRWTNITTAAVDVEYTITPFSSAPASCAGDAFVITVTVSPEPRGFNDITPTTCSDVAFNYDLTANVANTVAGGNNLTTGITFSWIATANPNVTGESLAPQTGSIINDILNNITNTVQVVRYTVTPTVAGCVGDPFTVDVNVQPEPRGYTDNSPIICSDAAVNYDLVANITNTVAGGNNLTAGTTYSWVATANGSVAGESTTPQAGNSINDILNNVTSINQIVEYTVTPTNAGCVGDPFVIRVNVRPEPVGQPDNSLVVCSNNAFTYNIQTSNIDLNNAVPSRFTFTVSSSNETAVPTPTGLDRTVASSLPISGNFQNLSGADVIVSYNITPFSTSGNCAGNPFVVQVTIQSQPTANPLTTLTACSDEGLNVNLQALITNSLASQFRYTVSSSNPLAVFPAANRTVATAAPITDTYTNLSNADVTITYTVTPVSTAGACAGTPFDVRITIHPEPLGISVTDPICATSLNHDLQARHVSVTGGNSLPAVFTYTVSSSNPAPNPAGVPPGPDRITPSAAPITDAYVNNSGAAVTITYLVTPFNAANPTCGGTQFTYTVTISSTPVGVSSTESAICSDVAYSINPQTNVNTPPGNSVASTFTWTAVYDLGLSGGAASGTGLISETITNNTTGVKNAIYTVVPKAGNCTGPSFTITKPINPEPVVDPSVTPRTTCSDVVSGIVLAGTATSEVPSAYDISLLFKDPDLVGTPTAGLALAANALQNNQFTNRIRTNGLFVRWNVTPYGPLALGACQGNPLVVQLEVLPEPVMDPGLANLNVCSDVANGIELITDGISATATSFYVNTVEVTSLAIAPGATVGAVAAKPANVAPNSDPITGAKTRNAIRNDVFTVTTNVAAASRTVVYNVTPRTGNCFGDPFNINLEIRPEPVIQATVTPPVCSDVPFNISLTQQPTSVSIDSYNINSINWDLLPAPGLQPGASNFATGVQDVNGPGAAGNLTINDRYTNATDIVLKARYTITPTSLDGCVGDPSLTEVDVSPAATVATGLDRIVCSDAVSGIVIQDQRTATGVGFPAQSFRVTPNVASTTGLDINQFNPASRVVNGASSTTIQSDDFINPTNQPVTVNYVVEAWTGLNATGCTSSRTIGLTVEPAIITNLASAMNLRPDICAGDVTEIVLGSPSNPTPAGLTAPFSSPTDITFNYTVTGASVAPGFNLPEAAPNNVIQQTINNNTDNPITATFRITPIAANARGGLGCTGTPTDVPVIVRPKPRMSASTSNITICEDVALEVTLNSTTNSNSGSVTGAGPVEFDLQSILDTNTGNPSTFITVASNPAGPNVPPWFVLNDVPVSTALGQEAIRYQYRPQFTLGAATCLGDPIGITVTVSPRPRIAPIANFDVCSGVQFEQNITVQEADPALTLISWTAAVTTPSPTNVTGAAGGAGDQLTQVVFNRNPDAAKVVYTFRGNAFGCISPTQTLEVDVFPEPRMQGLARSFNICNGAPLNINLQSTSSPAITSFRWTVDNGGNTDLSGGVANPGPSSVINQTLSNAGTSLGTYTYTITPYVITPTKQCVGLDGITAVNVAPPVVGSLVSSDGDNSAFICENGRDFLFFEFDGLPLFEAVYTDGTSDFTLTRQGAIRVLQVNPATTTTYTLKSLRDGFGCFDANLNTPSNRPSVTVNVGVTNANFDLITPAIACSPYQAQFQHNQVAGVNYTWKWFDGVADSTYMAGSSVANQVVRHTFFNPSPNGNVRYKVYLESFLDNNYPGGCLKTTFREVQVYPTISTGVFPDKNVICSGEDVTFTNSSQGVTQSTWFYRPQGSTQQLETRSTSNVTYKLENTSTSNPLVMEVVYRSTNGNCPAPDVVTPITVYRGVAPNFANTPPTLFVAGSSRTTITNTSVPVDNADFSYDWEFGLNANPGTANGVGPFNLNYSTPGPKVLRLTVTNRAAQTAGLTCVSSIERTIQIAVPPLIADFVATPLRACFPTDITVTENQATGDVFEWRVFDSNGRVAAVSNVVLPVFQIPNPGRYTIQLTTRNTFTGDQRTALRDAEIFPKPVASFQLRPDVVYVPDTELTTFNFSEGANEYEWAFGDGATSIDREPKHKYKVEGRYDVQMIAMFDHGGGVVCSDTLTNKVTAKQGGITLLPNAFTPDPSGPRGGVPGGAGTNSFNDVFLPIVKGAEEFNMQVFDRWGNLIFESNNAQVGWDGYDRNGRLMPNGVYVYKLTLRLSDGQRTTQIGDITLIR